MTNKIKIFAHRGYVSGFYQGKEVRENSLESLNLAYQHKFDGVEYDVWYFSDELIINHDDPKGQDLNELLKFKEYFKYKNELKYWIDFKNLHKISFEKAKKALKLVKKEVDENNIKLENIYFAPFIIDYDLAFKISAEIRNIFSDNSQIMIVIDKINKSELKNFRKKLDDNKIKHISVNHKNINQEFVEIFKGIEIFAWTINDISRLKELKTLKITNITSDIITYDHV